MLSFSLFFSIAIHSFGLEHEELPVSALLVSLNWLMSRTVSGLYPVFKSQGHGSMCALLLHYSTPLESCPEHSYQL